MAKKDNKENEELKTNETDGKETQKDDKIKQVTLKNLAAVGSGKKTKKEEEPIEGITINPLKKTNEKIDILMDDLDVFVKLFKDDIIEITNEDKLNNETYMQLYSKVYKKIIKNIILSYTDSEFNSLIVKEDKRKVSVLRRLTDMKIKGDVLDENDEKLYQKLTSSRNELIKYYDKMISLSKLKICDFDDSEIELYAESLNVVMYGVDAVEYLKESIKKQPTLEFIINKVIDIISIDNESVLSLFKPSFMDFKIDDTIDEEQLRDENDVCYMMYLGIIQGGLKNSTINITNPESRRIFIDMGLLQPNEDELESMEEDIVEVEEKKEEIKQEDIIEADEDLMKFLNE